MILQPTLVLLCGSGAEQLKDQVVRWIGEDERHAFYFAHISEAEEMEHTIPVAVHELRSAKLLSELIRGGYVPKNYRLQEFRTLIVCLSEDQDWIRTARRQLEVSLEATPFLNRIFWVVLLEQEKIQELQDTQQKLFADFGGNESVTLFHVLPFWRGSNLDPEDTSAILERLTVLLLKSDTEASLPMIAEIARNKSAWAIGIEAYRLKGHCEAGKCALFLAARELIAQCFTGQPLSGPTLANLVREKIPDFDSQADLDPFSPEGLELVGRYVRDYVPELLDALASHSPDVESWLDCLKHLKREAAKPKRAGLLGSGGSGPDGKAKPGYSGLSVLLMTVSAAACYLLFKPNAASAPAEQMNLTLTGPTKTKQDLPHHPIFAAALERILADIQPLRYPERLQESLPVPEVETPIPTDNVETAKVDRTLIDAARDLLLKRTFALPSLLSFQFLTGEMTPASAMTRVLSAQEEMEKKLEGILIDEWLTKVRQSRREKTTEADSEWLDFMFASPIPNPVHLECEIADHENHPRQPGWFPQSWLHYVHAVEIR